MTPAETIDRLRANLAEARRYARSQPSYVEAAIDTSRLDLLQLRSDIEKPDTFADHHAYALERVGAPTDGSTWPESEPIVGGFEPPSPSPDGPLLTDEDAAEIASLEIPPKPDGFPIGAEVRWADNPEILRVVGPVTHVNWTGHYWSQMVRGVLAFGNGEEDYASVKNLSLVRMPDPEIISGPEAFRDHLVNGESALQVRLYPPRWSGPMLWFIAWLGVASILVYLRLKA